MSQARCGIVLPIVATAAIFVTPALALAATDSAAAREQIEQAKREAGPIPEQAHALAGLAWPRQEFDPLVAAMAREELVNFGPHAFPALLRAMQSVERLYSGDVAGALLEARRRDLANIPAAYLPAMEHAVWEGSEDARRIAIPELAMFQYSPALLACIDAAIEDPSLLVLTIRALGRFGNERARYYLAALLEEGPVDMRPLVAQSLALIGGRAMAPLRDAALDPDPAVRHPAIRSLIPASRIDDLTVLFEYLASFPDDDPTIVGGVRSRAEVLEQVVEQQLDYDEAGPSPQP